LKLWTIAIIFLATACSASGVKPQATGFILGACEDGSLPKNAHIWHVGKNAFGTNATSTCSESRSSGIEIKSPLNIIPYRNGLTDLEFACDSGVAKRFYDKHAGKKVLFVLADQAIGIASVPDHPSTARCAILGLPSLREAISTCKAIGAAASLDVNQCLKLCDKDKKDAWACVVHR
jgi:hypothetical protein